jgi:heparan-alpha-glucosaminide N-acetyltransferase
MEAACAFVSLSSEVGRRMVRQFSAEPISQRYDLPMNPTVEAPLTSEAPRVPEAVRTTAPRVISIDVFRGLTMAVMIFVNALSEVHGLPWWTRHAHANDDVMTYVDMVFPFFLFAVGMSLPLSIGQRLKRTSSFLSMWVHVAVRALGLVVLGEILANAEKADRARMGMSGSTWALLALICAALYLNVYGSSKRAKTYSQFLRAVGLGGVILLLALFRRTTTDGQVAWLDFSYPEILGLIGYSYLAVAILFIPTRRWRWAPVVWLTLLVSLCAITAAKIATFPDQLPLYLWPFGNGAMCCIIMAGVITSGIFLRPDGRVGPNRAIPLAMGFSIITLLAGRALVPLGISKIRATPTWSLYSIAASVLLFTLLYWICDLRQWQRWAMIVRPAGSNTLLTYLLPDLWYFLLSAVGFTYLDVHFDVGWAGVAKTVLFTFFMLGVAGVLTRAKIRLQF